MTAIPLSFGLRWFLSTEFVQIQMRNNFQSQSKNNIKK